MTTKSSGVKAVWKWIVGGLVGIAVIGGIVAAVVLTTGKKTSNSATDNQVHASQSIVFQVTGSQSAFKARQTDFLNEVAFAGSFDVEDVKVAKIEERSAEGVILVTVNIGSVTADELSAGLKAIAASWKSWTSRFGVVELYLNSSDVPEAATVIPSTSVPSTDAVATTDAPTTSDSAPFEKRINCGGTFDYVDGEGNVWSADSDFTGGVAWKKVGVTGDVVYDTERFFQNLADTEGYHIPVPRNGQYAVNLTFVELTQPLAGARTFQVIVENVNPTGGVLDIAAQAGDIGIPVFASVIVDVTDLVLDIKFIKIKQNPKITAIEISSL